MKARIKETGEVVDVEYDDDDLYVVIGRCQYLYASEFDFITEPEEEVTIEGVAEKCKDGITRVYVGQSINSFILSSDINIEGEVAITIKPKKK